MVYKPHTLIAFGGGLQEVSGFDEIWECTIRAVAAPGGVPNGNPLDEAGIDQYMEHMAPLVSAWFSSAGAHNSSQVKLQWLKVNNIGADGRYTGDTTHVHDYTGTITGSSTPIGPSFLSIALSWTTARNRPPAAFGRIYPPNNTIAPAVGTSAITSSDQTALATAAGSLLAAVANRSGVIYAMPVIASAVGAGRNEPITGIRVGNVYDVQRRRKNAVRETYASMGWAPPS